MTEIVDYGRFKERLDRVMPRWDLRDSMPHEEFVEHLGATAPRWELLREFQEEWGYRPSGPPRWRRWTETEHKAYMRMLKAELQGTEEEDRFAGVDLRLPIPKALDEWWELPHNSFVHDPRLYWTNPEWPPTVRPDPSGYGVSDGLPENNPFTAPDGDRRLCVFMAEYEYCNEWGYLAGESDLPDPMVLVSATDEEDDPDKTGWLHHSRSISEFFLQLAVVRVPATLGWTVEEHELQPEVVRRLEERLGRMGFLPWRELGAKTHLFGAPDAIVCRNEGEGDFELLAYGRTREALEAVARTLELDWTEWISKPRGLSSAAE